MAHSGSCPQKWLNQNEESALEFKGLVRLEVSFICIFSTHQIRNYEPLFRYVTIEALKHCLVKTTLGKLVANGKILAPFFKTLFAQNQSIILNVLRSCLVSRSNAHKCCVEMQHADA